jgi:hypothetical protein
MARLTIQQEAIELLRAGATPSEIDEMEAGLRFCTAGISFRNGAWKVSPPVARVLGGTPPSDALPRLERGIEVCKAARLLID